MCVPAFGQPFVTLAWTLWWLDSIVSVVIAIGLPFMMFTRHVHKMETVTAVWLLPVVSPIVAAAAGGIVANVLQPNQARLTIIISYIMLGTGLFPAILIMGLYFQRLAIHKVGHFRSRHLPVSVIFVFLSFPLVLILGLLRSTVSSFDSHCQRLPTHWSMWSRCICFASACLSRAEVAERNWGRNRWLRRLLNC